MPGEKATLLHAAGVAFDGEAVGNDIDEVCESPVVAPAKELDENTGVQISDMCVEEEIKKRCKVKDIDG